MLMVKFEKFEDLIQFFANEYITPKSLVLVIGPGEYIPFFKKMLNFLNSEVIFMEHFYYPGIDITNELAPFEKKSFNTVIDLKKTKNVLEIVKSDGVILVSDEIINAKENYLLKNSIFSVI